MIVFSIHVCCVSKHVAVISVSLFFQFFLGFWYLPVASLSWHIKLCLQGLKPFAELILVLTFIFHQRLFLSFNNKCFYHSVQFLSLSTFINKLSWYSLMIVLIIMFLPGLLNGFSWYQLIINCSEHSLMTILSIHVWHLLTIVLSMNSCLCEHSLMIDLLMIY